jgi:hypothetical protein
MFARSSRQDFKTRSGPVTSFTQKTTPRQTAPVKRPGGGPTSPTTPVSALSGGDRRYWRFFRRHTRPGMLLDDVWQSVGWCCGSHPAGYMTVYTPRSCRSIVGVAHVYSW